MNNTWDQNVNKGCFAIIVLNFLCLGSVLLANYLIVKLIVFVGTLCCPVLLCCFINFVRQAQVILRICSNKARRPRQKPRRAYRERAKPVDFVKEFFDGELWDDEEEAE